NNLRGNKLVRVHRALDKLKADPLGLDRARIQFSQSPLLYTSNLSGTTTRSASPDTRSDEQRRRKQQIKSDNEKQRIIKRRAIQKRERKALRLYYQFAYQISKERERI
ncbi:hypothetical protein DL98DRAFT_432891, partial [Cadophora sp. DSE1049]